ncbi:MAG: type II toxin-antitoxin system VapC family toxin [Candidatus Hydrothermarchaeales archaeon]
MTVLIDSWAWIEYFRGSEKGKTVVPIIESDEEIIVSAINLAEVYYTTLKKKGRETAKKQRDAIEMRCRIIGVDAEIATRGAEIKLERKWGLADAIILATAEIENVTLLTGDPHFKGMPNVEFLGE